MIQFILKITSTDHFAVKDVELEIPLVGLRKVSK